MRELTENEMNLVAGGISLHQEDNNAFTPPSIPSLGGSAKPSIGSGSAGSGSSGGDVKKIVQDACGEDGADTVTVTNQGPSGSAEVGYTPPKKLTVGGSYDSGSTTVTVDCN